MIFGRSKKKRPVKLFVMNAKVLKKRRKPPNFSPLTREKAIRLGLVVAVVFTCGFGGAVVGRHLLSDPRYAVKHIIVRGNRRLLREEIVRLSLLKRGENIFRCRIHRAKDRLSRLPLVRDVSVTKFMPDIVVIEIAERVARARLSDSNKLLADYSGVVLPRSCCDEPEKLPLIVGVDTAKLSVGEKCADSAMSRALRVLRLCRTSRLSDLVEVDVIDTSRPDESRLYLKEGEYTKRECEVRMGVSHFEEKLSKLAEILESVVRQHNKKIQSVNLTLDTVPVRF